MSASVDEGCRGCRSSLGPSSFQRRDSRAPGLVGMTTAYTLLMSGAAGEIVLIGRDRESIEGHVNHQRDATSYSYPGPWSNHET